VNVLTPPRPIPVEEALALARDWCHGHTIDGAPALRHACAVAVAIGQHWPDAPPELIAAALLHDSPEYAGKRRFRSGLSAAVLELIEAIDAEHQAMATFHRDPALGTQYLSALPPTVLIALAADKVVSLGTILRHAADAGAGAREDAGTVTGAGTVTDADADADADADVGVGAGAGAGLGVEVVADAEAGGYWRRRRAFLDQVPYFRRFTTVITGLVPGVPSVPNISRVPEVSTVPNVSGVPGLPRRPGVPAVPRAPGVPQLPGLPRVPGVTGVPTVPGAPRVPLVRGVPGVPFTLARELDRLVTRAEHIERTERGERSRPQWATRPR
jgi:hypothetical protein